MRSWNHLTFADKSTGVFYNYSDSSNGLTFPALLQWLKQQVSISWCAQKWYKRILSRLKGGGRSMWLLYLSTVPHTLTCSKSYTSRAYSSIICSKRYLHSRQKDRLGLRWIGRHLTRTGDRACAKHAVTYRTELFWQKCLHEAGEWIRSYTCTESLMAI